MIKELLATTDLTIWAEISLLIFAAVFIAVSIRTLLGDSRQSRCNASIVLADEGSQPHD